MSLPTEGLGLQTAKDLILTQILVSLELLTSRSAAAFMRRAFRLPGASACRGGQLWILINIEVCVLMILTGSKVMLSDEASH